MILLALLLWLLAINAITFATFAWDKSCARRRAWRVPESRLLLLAFIGGWPGAKFAQRRLRHKTVKMPFARQLNNVPPWQILVLGCGLILWASSGMRDLNGLVTSVFAQEEQRPLPRRFGPGS